VSVVAGPTTNGDVLGEGKREDSDRLTRYLHLAPLPSPDVRTGSGQVTCPLHLCTSEGYGVPVGVGAAGVGVAPEGAAPGAVVVGVGVTRGIRYRIMSTALLLG